MSPDIQFLRENARWLAAGALLAFSSAWGQTFFIAIFAGDIQAAFGLSHGAWGALYAAGTTVSAIVMLWMGTLADRFRTRGLAPVVLLGLALACVTMALNPFLALLPVSVFLLRLTGQGMTSHIATVSIARWFTRSRGKALAVTTLGFALAESILPLVFVALKEVLPWRLLWGIAALLALAVIPVLRVLLRRERTPASVAADSPTVGMEGRHWRRIDMLWHPLFWCLVPVFLAPPAVLTALFFQQVHLSEVKGVSHLALVALFPFYTVASISAMLASGWAIDRFGCGRLMPVFLIPLTLGFVVMGLFDGLWALGLGFVLAALTSGGYAPLASAFWAEAYGTRHLGAIKAAAVAVMVFGSALGPLLTGALIDLGWDFPAQMLGIAVYLVAASLLAGLAISWFGRGLTVAP